MKRTIHAAEGQRIIVRSMHSMVSAAHIEVSSMNTFIGAVLSDGNLAELITTLTAIRDKRQSERRRTRRTR